MKANKYRTHMCGNLSEQEAGQSVRVAGWVENIRDHGGVIFVDLIIFSNASASSIGFKSSL